MTKPVPTSIHFQNNQLKDRVYLVTGASGGLGGVTALALAKLGASVILSGRNEKKLDRLYDTIEAENYPQAAIIPFDLALTDGQIYEQLAQSIYNEFKRLDGIVHAACHLGVIGPLASQEPSEWLKTQQVNVNACLLINKACAPLLLQSDAASITAISDSSARQNKAYWGAYGVSKSALEAFSATLADEFENSPINCNVFIPGPCVLPIRKKTHPGEEVDGLSTTDTLADAILQVIHSDQSGQCYSL